MTALVDQHQLHQTIGLIYDSALDPAVWPSALESACGLLDGCYGSISVMDPLLREMKLAAEWCPDPDWPQWKKLLEEKYAALMPFYGSLLTWDVGEVHNTAQMAAMQGMESSQIYEHPFFKEWALPAGRLDSIGCVVLKNATRFGLFNVHTSTQRELTGQRELDICAQLAPHLRRAVTIGDFLGKAAIHVATLQVTLDGLNAAVVVTDAQARIVYANSAGEAMLTSGSPIGVRDGQLQAKEEQGTLALRKAIGQTADPVGHIDSYGIGVPLRTGDGSPAIAHVLLLARGGQRRDLGPRASAAVFVAPIGQALPQSDALIGLYGLTPSEARVLLQIASGKRRAEAAALLGMSDHTAKTHLERVYDKTGTKDQAELARLIAALGSPARLRPGGA
jgi:DNA-binding CsgD family transcriptional regulator/PAS domain-containing protein